MIAGRGPGPGTLTSRHRHGGRGDDSESTLPGHCDSDADRRTLTVTSNFNVTRDVTAAARHGHRDGPVSEPGRLPQPTAAAGPPESDPAPASPRRRRPVAAPTSS